MGCPVFDDLFKFSHDHQHTTASRLTAPRPGKSREWRNQGSRLRPLDVQQSYLPRQALQSGFHDDIELETSITKTVCVRIHTYTIVDYPKLKLKLKLKLLLRVWDAHSAIPSYAIR